MQKTNTYTVCQKAQMSNTLKKGKKGGFYIIMTSKKTGKKYKKYCTNNNLNKKSSNTWLLHLKKCAKQYRDNKILNKPVNKPVHVQKTKGQKMFNNVITKIEKNEKLKQQISENRKLIRRIRGSRF